MIRQNKKKINEKNKKKLSAEFFLATNQTIKKNYKQKLHIFISSINKYNGLSYFDMKLSNIFKFIHLFFL